MVVNPSKPQYIGKITNTMSDEKTKENNYGKATGNYCVLMDVIYNSEFDLIFNRRR
jgi:hypothetical protein